MIKNGDFLSDDLGDLKIQDGDFFCGEADSEHVIDIFNSSPGHWKEFPLLGVGIDSYRNSSGKANELAKIAKIQLESDHYKVYDLVAKINGNEVDIIVTGQKNYDGL